MFLVIGSGNISYRPKQIEQKKGLLQRLFPKKQQPLLESKETTS